MLPTHKLEILKVSDRWFCHLLELKNTHGTEYYIAVNSVDSDGYLELMRLAAIEGFIELINK